MTRSALWLRFACALMIATGATALSVTSARADGAGGGEPEWSCESSGSSSCCECSRSNDERICREIWDDGIWSARCGLTDDAICTGTCGIF